MAITKISPSVVDFDAGITISTADNSNNLTLTSTDADANSGPNLLLKRDNNSAAGDDVTGTIVFQAEDAGNNLTDYIAFKTMIQDATGGSEDGRLKLELMSGGTARNILDISGSNAVVFNEDSQNIDFRVESDGNANALVINGGNNNVGIGADPLASYAGYTTLYVGGNTNFMSNTAAEASSSVNYSHNAQFDTDGSWEYIVTDEASNYYQAGGGHYFRVAASGSAGADITWVNGPNIDVNGNLVFPSGKGIDFSATADATGSSSELLDDYEEGSFTIGVSGTSATLGNTTAYYTKIGRLVYFFWYSGNSSFASSSGAATLTGLPFHQDGLSANYGLFQYVHGNSIDGDSTGGYITNNATTANFIDAGGVGGATFIDGSSKYIMVSGVYQTDA